MSKPFYPCIAPTNEPGSCRLCGSKLKPARVFHEQIELSEATEEQLSAWPRNPVWVADEGDPSTATFHGMFFAERQLAVIPSEDVGLNKGIGHWSQGTDIGDGLFCSAICAIHFARIAANAGLQLPSVMPKQRRELRRQHAAISAMCQEVLAPEPRNRPSKMKVKLEGTLSNRGRAMPEVWARRTNGTITRHKWDNTPVQNRIEDRNAAVPENTTLPKKYRGYY